MGMFPVGFWVPKTSPAAVASGVAFVTANGTRKHSGITLTNGNLTETGDIADGAFQIVSADTAKTGKRQFEVTATTVSAANGLTVGVDNGGTDFSVDIATPGASVTSGCTFRTNGSGSFTIHVNGANTAGGALTVSAGDVITCEYDTAAGTVTFYKNSVQIDLTQTGVTLTTPYAFVGGQSNVQNTGNFGGSAFTHALSSGYSAYQS